MHIHCLRFAFAALALASLRPCWAEHDIEYVAEHLPEAAMDNRYATLPIWGSSDESSAWKTTFQGAASVTKVGTISLEGPMLSMGLQRNLRGPWQLGAFAFYDDLSFSARRESRPLQTLFAPQTPFERPVDALFTNLDGRARDFGGGLYLARDGNVRFLGLHRWIAGVLWQRVQLTDYRFDYTLVDGPRSGITGQIDFDATYDHVAPFVGLEVPREFGQWTLALHGLLAYPLPRRGVAGHITGPGFDLSGDSASAGNGKHFGDPSITLGLNIVYRPAYRPARLSIDLGTLLSQALIEPVVHPGIDRNLLLSISWSY
jgi:hypothetical protein